MQDQVATDAFEASIGYDFGSNRTETSADDFAVCPYILSVRDVGPHVRQLSCKNNPSYPASSPIRQTKYAVTGRSD